MRGPNDLNQVRRSSAPASRERRHRRGHPTRCSHRLLRLEPLESKLLLSGFNEGVMDTVDGVDYLYASGTYHHAVDLDPNPDCEAWLSQSSGSMERFLVKYKLAETEHGRARHHA